MKIKLRTQIMIPFTNKFLPKDTIMEVIEIKGNYYICRNKEVYSIFIPKELCEAEEDVW